jgi:hypothetical protein
VTGSDRCTNPQRIQIWFAHRSESGHARRIATPSIISAL